MRDGGKAKAKRQKGEGKNGNVRQVMWAA